MKRNPLSRLLSVLLCLCLVAGMLPAALAESQKITLDLYDNKTTTLTPNESDGDGSLSWTWKSDPEGVVTIDNGTITAIKEGTTTVTATSSAPEKFQSWTVEVTDSTPSTPVKVESVTIDQKDFSIEEGGSETLTATVKPDNAEDKAVTWSSSNNNVATFGPNGLLEAKKAGKTEITATAGGVTSAPITVEVTAKADPTIELDSKSLSLIPGESSTLTATVKNGSADDIKWETSNKNIEVKGSGSSVTVKASDTAKAGDTATITASIGSVKATCDVTVTNDPTVVIGISISPRDMSIPVNGTVTLTANVTPATASNKTVTWSASPSANVTLTPSGKDYSECTVVAKNTAGSVIITATTSNGLSDRITLQVTNTTIPVTGVTLQPSTASIPINGTVKLTATVAPSNATNKKVIWSSSDTKVATVDGNGNVVGKAKGTATITVTTEDGSKTAKCTVNVGTASTITYTVAADDTVTLKASDFNSVCNGVYGTTLDYVIFDRSTSNGTLYYDYTTKDGGTKISTSTKYYYSNSASRSISGITFVPDGKSGDKATFPYTAYDTKGQRYAGTLEITIKSPSGNIKYETAKDEPVDFDSGDFDDVCRSITGSRLDYVTFTLPSSSRGTLYYDYGGKDEEKLSSSDKCYADEDDGDFGLDGITFVPKSGYTGTVTFNYSGRSTSRDSFSGTVTITISKTGSTLRYQIDEGEELDLDDSDFNDYCKDQTGANLDYVTFDLPGSSRGTLYYKYGSRDEDDISSSDKFYRSSSPRLDDVTFVPKSGYTGIVSIDFTGRSVDNDRFSGTVKIEVGDTGSGDISYTAPAGSAVSFVLSDFNDLCEDETGERLDYVTFDLPSSSRGTLYYQYGKSGEEKLSSSDKYYRSGSPRLEDVSFVPASSFSGTLEIKFSGRSTDNDRFSGTVAITYTSVKDPAIVRYTSDGGAVNFQSNDFVSACSIRGAGNLVSVKFNTPSSGTLYYGYTSPTSYGGVVNPLISFSTGTGNASISGVTYVPKAGYSGTVTLTYTGTDSKGATFTGNIAITVTPTTGSRFTDMGNYSWAAASVDFLYENGITTGTTDTTYGPAGNITRGDFVLMLARAFNLTGGAPSNSFSDVPANSYYAQAIASAKALGIAQGGGSTFNPTGALTRQDAMVLLHRTLSRTGKTIPDASASYLSRFSDGGSVASYAQSSVAALVQAGVIQGDTSGKLNPQGSLTRAEMAVILHRVLTL